MLKSIISTGERKSYSILKNKSIRLMNTMGLMTGFCALTFTIAINIIVNFHVSVPLICFTLISFSLIKLNHSGYHKLARHIYILSFIFCILLLGLLVGPDSGFFAAYFFIIGIIFIFFGQKEKAYIFLYGFLCIACAVLSISGLSLFIEPPNLSASDKLFFKIGCTITALTLIWLVGLGFLRENVKHIHLINSSLNQTKQLLSEKESIEKSLIQAKEKAEKAAHVRREFLSTMSHEIRTPLNAIIGLTSLLVETTLDGEQSEFVKTIRLSGESLLSVINDILDFSKIESGKLELEEHPFELINPIEDVFELLSKTANNKGLELIYFIKPDVPKFVFGDSDRLRQILINLVNNAIKFTEKGEVFVEVTYEVKDIDSSIIKFEIRDTGIGIPKEKMDRLFKSFTQVDSSTTRKYGGTGLGLVICHRLVKLMNGNIWAKSKMGKGSSFFFTIEVKEAIKGKLLNKETSHLNPSDKNILVVDDNLLNLKILKKQFERWGLKAECTEDPILALEIAKNKNFHLFILDRHMSPINGLELASELHKICKGEKPAILLLSSSTTSLSEEEKVLFDQILTKPVRQTRLKNAVQKSLFRFNQKIVKNHKEKASTPWTNENKKSIKILMAEDNLANQKVMKQILKRLGYEANIVNNGLEAVEAVKMARYDLILMDIQMPEMDGIEATKKIVEHFEKRKEAQPKIVALTANAVKEDMEQGLNAGMVEYLIKPIKKSIIQDLLVRHFYSTTEV